MLGGLKLRRSRSLAALCALIVVWSCVGAVAQTRQLDKGKIGAPPQAKTIADVFQDAIETVVSPGGTFEGTCRVPGVGQCAVSHSSPIAPGTACYCGSPPTTYPGSTR